MIARVLAAVVAVWIGAGVAAPAYELTHGRQVLLDHGLQIQALTFTPPVHPAGCFTDINVWLGANFTTLGLYDPYAYSTPRPAGVFEHGRAWSRMDMTGWSFTSEELPYVDDLVSIQYLDERSDVPFADFGVRFRELNTLYPKALAYTNFWGSQLNQSQLTSFTQTAQPDLLMFDVYPGYDSGFYVSGGHREYWYATMQKYRTTALAGYTTSTGANSGPLPYGQWLYLFRNSYSKPLPSESFVRLQQNASWAFGYTFVDAFVYNQAEQFTTEDPSHICSVMFSAFGDDPANKTAVFGYMAETNRQSRNLGPALVRLVNTDIRMIPGKVGGVADSLPPGVSAWTPGAGGDSYITGITPLGKDLAHPSTTNYSDVLIGYFKPLLADNRAAPFVDGTHFMIVNGAWQGAAAALAEWYHLTFDFLGTTFDSLVRLSRDTGRVELVSLNHDGGSQYSLDLNLEGGTGDLFGFWDSSQPLPDIPEPGTLVLLGTALLGLLGYAWRRRRV